MIKHAKAAQALLFIAPPRQVWKWSQKIMASALPQSPIKTCTDSRTGLPVGSELEISHQHKPTRIEIRILIKKGNKMRLLVAEDQHVTMRSASSCLQEDGKMSCRLAMGKRSFVYSKHIQSILRDFRYRNAHQNRG